MIPQNLRKDILEGKEVNLAAILLASQDITENKTVNCGEVSVTLKAKDPRLAHKLTIPEFVLAFSVYRDIICTISPHRRQELDTYMYMLVDLGHRYGGFAYYDYHKSFAAKAAAALSQFNYHTDWSSLDNELFCRHFAGLKLPTCQICQANTHSTQLCPSSVNANLLVLPSTNRPQDPTTSSEITSRPTKDKLGRTIHYIGNSPICNNFNTLRPLAFLLFFFFFVETDIGWSDCSILPSPNGVEGHDDLSPKKKSTCSPAALHKYRLYSQFWIAHLKAVVPKSVLSHGQNSLLDHRLNAGVDNLMPSICSELQFPPTLTSHWLAGDDGNVNAEQLEVLRLPIPGLIKQ
ncbi:uncharacterized protein WCC33_000946 [Rhinophrynus dorsalis]